MKKRLAGILVTAALSAAFTSTVWADWKKEDSNWYYYSDETGEKMTGWQQVEGLWYYLEPENNGIMHTGWLTLNNKKYFCDWNTGEMKQNQVFCTCNAPVYGDGFLYQALPDGELRRSGEDVNPQDPEERVIYCDDGKLKLKDSISVGRGVATGDSYYQYVLCDHYKEIQYDGFEEDIRNGIIEYTERYNDQYINKVKTASSRTRQERLEKWKESVARKLRQLRVEDEWIQKYYNDVFTGKFENGDEWVDYMEKKINGDWTGDYEDDEDWDD